MALGCRKRGGQENIFVLLAFSYCWPLPNAASLIR